MVIAIFFKDNIDITLMDSLNKRLIFLEEVVKKLHFKNVKIVHERSEDASHKDIYRQKFDIVVSRAFARLSELIEYTSAFLKVGGKCLFMKGPGYKEELENSKKSMIVLNCKLSNIYNYELVSDEEKYTRAILDIEKTSDTPKNYPRIYSKIKKNPL